MMMARITAIRSQPVADVYRMRDGAFHANSTFSRKIGRHLPAHRAPVQPSICYRDRQRARERDRERETGIQFNTTVASKFARFETG